MLIYQHHMSVPLKEKSYFLHQPCPVCSSSDALSVNEDGSAFCFSCNTRLSKYQYGENVGDEMQDLKVIEKEPLTFAEQGTYVRLTDRGISEQTARKYGVRCELNQDVSIAKHIYPYYRDKEIVAFKERILGDTGKQNFYS